ncbi:hypothetical protein [Gilliamella sp. wkB171]|nr:hypothetical protein [Gilliamella apicola]
MIIKSHKAKAIITIDFIEKRCLLPITVVFIAIYQTKEARIDLNEI